MASKTAMTVDGVPVVWRDLKGILHYCDGNLIHPGVRLIWTTCGCHDVPANTAWRQRGGEVVNCTQCIARASED